MRKSDLVAMSHFRKDRDVSLPFTLQLSPADSPYVIFPMTHEKGVAGNFFLNVWHKKELFIRGGEVVVVDEAAGSELDEDPWEEFLPQEHEEYDPDVSNRVIVLVMFGQVSSTSLRPGTSIREEVKPTVSQAMAAT
eukprot:754920-Hanusia_phi.AAC.1